MGGSPRWVDGLDNILSGQMVWLRVFSAFCLGLAWMTVTGTALRVMLIYSLLLIMIPYLPLIGKCNFDFVHGILENLGKWRVGAGEKKTGCLQLASIDPRVSIEVNGVSAASAYQPRVSRTFQCYKNITVRVPNL